MSSENKPLITEGEVRKVAHLARLRLDEENIGAYTKRLSNILDMIAQIDGKDTNDITPMASPLHETLTPLREDQVTEIDRRSLYQSIAPATESGFYLVPQVIE